MSGNGAGYKAVAWAWSVDTETPAQKLVLVNLAGRVDQSYSCFPSVRLIMAETGLSRSRVWGVIAELESMDLVMVASRTRPNGSHRSNRYYLNHPDALHVQGIVDDDMDPSQQEELERASLRAVKRQSGVQPLDPSGVLSLDT
ncbi:helix-turn-helix domain-containing protein [Gordonia sp. TBRC 11910]|uniref:Helix-turn-helix domain-containing protein n=1 Tax=Gordonia asplenii TaxID=2725283 RepID=A0A848KQ94_9ACTN|nr:helix-turn-helix domain-containing protein [Gordonia asplenii]NMO00856.1 helix-turn-helix domain-containing protein [Gordonia asplenii]